MKKAIILCAAMLCVALAAMGQAHYQIRHFGVTDELKVRSRVSIAQINGFMWIGTSNGLVVFDGKHTTLYPVPDREGLGGYLSRVTAVMQSPDGTIWVGSKRGLYIFDIDRERLREFHVEGLPEFPNIASLACDKEGHLWMLVNGLVYVVDVKHHQAEGIATQMVSPRCLTVARDGTVWMGDEEGLLYRYDPREKRLHSYTARPEGVKRFRHIVSITEMKDGQLAVASTKNGVCLFNPKTFTSRMLMATDEGREMSIHTTVAPDSETLWMGTERGIVVYHMKDGDVDHIMQSRHQPNSLTDNAVHSLFVDRERGVWAGTFFGGLNRISLSEQNFAVMVPEGEEDDTDVAREICPDAQGRLWVGTEDGGLYLLDQEKQRLEAVDMAWGAAGRPFNVQSLMRVDDELWALTHSGGIYVIDTERMTLKRHYAKTNEMGTGFTLGGISLCRQNGTIFVCSSLGVFIFDPKNQSFNLMPELLNTYAHHLYADRHGNVWVATFDKGLWKISKKKGQWKAEQTAFSYKCATVVMEDSRGYYWVGTDKHGLMGYDDQTGKTRKVENSKDLAQESVNNIMEDQEHNLWLNTFNGLYSYNTNTGAVTHLNTENGLPTNYMNYSGGYIDQKGTAYIGTYKGVVSFKASAFVPAKERLTPYFLNLYVDGKHITPGDSSKILPNTLFMTKELKLTFKQNTFTLIYATPTFQNGRVVWYRYRLNPDEPWVVTNEARPIQLTNLSPGRYEIALQASFNPEEWDGDMAVLPVHVAPPGWLSGGAIFGYVIVIIIAVIAAMTFITQKHKEQVIKKIRKRKAQEEEMEKEKAKDTEGKEGKGTDKPDKA